MDTKELNLLLGRFVATYGGAGTTASEAIREEILAEFDELKRAGRSAVDEGLRLALVVTDLESRLALADALAEVAKKGEKLLSYLFVDIPEEHEGIAQKALVVMGEMMEAHRAYVESQQ